MSIDVRKYLGLPYEKYNCFDIVKDFYKDFFDLDLSNYFEGSAVPNRKEISSLIISNKGDFVEVDTPEVGDIVVIRLFGFECHMGVCIGGGEFIHSSKGVGSHIGRLSRYQRLISGYYRHRAFDVAS
jgi:hypothetical protein